MAEQKSSSALAAPLHGAASVLRKVPGAGMVGRAAQGTLDKVGAVSPRGRRLAVYTGAGVLGVAGVVEWPVALTGAAVAWLTQPRPEHTEEPEHAEELEQTEEPEHMEEGHEQAPPAQPTPAATGTAARKTTRKRTGTSREPVEDIGSAALRSAQDTGSEGRPPRERTSTPAESGDTPTKSRASTGPLGPTARPDRTTL
ncbi:hypothetical protein RKE30_24495 [Streptomyces sp. Li-HN-5-11]|uniref:hypothetical protein n=1 Tax=Streptomyces sp. Li-HN-5-11 TaxID=3075432 RepID=UPI0028B123C0|nr:hypothetical protein [Streptomyces sp. Li-HN-5-11]WNM33320.1 hypothetical protein RKE30_24495 [Streptomyces sp. Li-HN-5-11]